MRLSELCNQSRIGFVEKDAEFEALGKLNALSKSNTLVFLQEEKYVSEIDSNMISAVITTGEIKKSLRHLNIGILVSDSPKVDFYKIHDFLIDSQFYFESFNTSVDESTRVHPTAFIASRNVQIGMNTIICPHVTILENTTIGNNCVIMPGTVIGTEGYEVIEQSGKRKIVRHAGWVTLSDYVQIEANNAISKGLFPTRNTELHEEVTTDNLVHIAHGVHVGKRTRIAASAMIAGSVDIGEDVWIGPSAVISSGIRIGDRAAITLGSVVTRSVEAGKRVSGNFAIDHERFIQFLKSIR